MKNQVLDKILKIKEECADDGWDYGHDRVKPLTVINAIKVLRELEEVSIEASPEDISPDNSGRITVDFEHGPDYVVVKISEHYARYSAGSTALGGECTPFRQLDGTGIEKIQEILKRKL